MGLKHFVDLLFVTWLYKRFRVPNLECYLCYMDSLNQEKNRMSMNKFDKVEWKFYCASGEKDLNGSSLRVLLEDL